MNDDMSELMGKLNDMLNSDSSNDLKNLLNNLTSSNNNSNSNSNSSETSKSNKNNDNNERNSSDVNIDFDTIMKIKSIMDALNTKKDDPRAKLLLSLKPYLKDSRKNKLDQYVQLLNMSSVFELFKNSGGDLNAKL